MSLWSEQVFPRAYDAMLWWGERRSMRRLRAQTLAAARGRTLEIGAGTGLNLAHYGDAVTELVLTEPEPAMAAKLRRRAAASPRPTTVVEAGAQRLPFDDDAFDTIVSTLVLCTVPDLDAALAELGRVLHPDGRLLFVEHVRAAPGSALARWQRRLHGPWLAFAAGCHCDRETVGALRTAGFELERERAEQWRGGPALLRPLRLGAATLSRPRAAT